MTTIFLFLLFSLSLFSSPSHERDPMLMVEGCVHAITGDLVISDNDLPDYPMHRVYVSKEGKWTFAPQARLVLYGKKVEEKEKKKKKKKKDKDKEKYSYELVMISEPNGSPLLYRLSGEDRFEIVLPTGFTNTARGAIGARNDLNNQTLVRNDTFTFTLLTPNGTKRIYKKAFALDHDLHFLLTHEELPNGRVYQYEYDQQHRIHLIRSGDRICKTHHISTTDFEVEGQGGKKIAYRFAMQKDTPQLKRIEMGQAEESFDYTSNRLTKWVPSEGETLLIEYTQDGKVASLKKDDGSLLHSFSYFNQQTVVLHRDGSRTSYYYTPTLLPVKIETDTEVLEMSWSSDGKIQSKIRRTREGEILSSQTYTYDRAGNPIKEVIDDVTIIRVFDALNRVTKVKNKQTTEFGYLKNTDLVTTKILTSSGTTLRTFFEYGTVNELTKVTIDDGPNPTYVRVMEIEGGPERPTSVVEKADTTLLKKTVYTYEPDGIIEEIYDADLSLCLKRSTSVSGIHRPWKETIPIGISHEDGYEIERDYFGRVIAKRLFDAQGMLLEEETWVYNALFLLFYKDKTGLVTEYSYNREGRKVREVIHSSLGDIEKFFSYDSHGRLEKIQEGALFTCFSYDDDDQIIEKRFEDLEENLLQKFSYSYSEEGISVIQYTSHGHATYPLEKQLPPSKVEPLPGVTSTYDSQGRLIELVSEDKTIHYSVQYNKRGQPTLVVDHATGTSGRRSYDDLGNLVKETLQNGQTLKNSYDLRSRKTTLLLPDGSEIYYKWGPKFLEEVHRITDKGKYEYRHYFLHYDLAGFPTKQRLSEGFGELSFEIDNDLCIAAISSRHLQERAEDLAPLELEEVAKSYSFLTDPLGRITLFEQPTRKIYYTYDFWNRRMSKRVRELKDGVWTETLHVYFLYDGDQEIGTVDVEEGWIKQLRVLAPHPINPGDQAIAYELEGMPYVPLHDLHGNVRKLLSVIRRKVMETYLFSYSGREQIADFWGDLIPLSKANNPWRFGSHWTDEETGLIYINGDFYDPQKKVFIGNRYRFLERPQLFQLPKETHGS